MDWVSEHVAVSRSLTSCPNRIPSNGNGMPDAIAKTNPPTMSRTSRVVGSDEKRRRRYANVSFGLTLKVDNMRLMKANCEQVVKISNGIGQKFIYQLVNLPMKDLKTASPHVPRWRTHHAVFVTFRRC